MNVREEIEKDDSDYLRPHALAELKEEAERIEDMLNAPRHIRQQMQDVPAAVQTLRRMKRQIEHGSPRPFKSEDVAEAIKVEREIRNEIVGNGMPTQAEMRRNPAGAVEKHIAFEKRNKRKIKRWKNARLRLHAGGHLDAADRGEAVANLEVFRPVGGSAELPMHNEQIAAKAFYIPPNIEVRNVMSDEERAAAQAETATLMAAIAMSDRERRKAALKALME